MSTTRGLLDTAAASLRAACAEGDKVSAARLDARQLVSYELAVSWSEATAAGFLLDHAKRLLQDAPDPFVTQLAALFCAETVTGIAARLRARPSDYGLEADAIDAATGSADALAFIDAQLGAANIENLGEQVLARGADLGSDLLDEDHGMMRDTFRRFADDVVVPLAEKVHREDLDIPDEILEPLKEMGLFGLSIPESYGGLQANDEEDTLGMIVVTEELSRGSLGAAGSLITRPEILARALLKGGTEDQKKYWLPRLATGEPLCAVAVTEPGYGSDVAGVRLKATPVEGGWVLDGAKTWCTFGGRAGVLMVLARTDTDMSLAHRGLSMFLVEKPDSAGHSFEVNQDDGGKLSGRAIATLGYRGMHSFELFFDGFFVPQENMLGGADGEGKGFYYAMAGFAGGRIQTAARAVGVMRAAFERAATYAGERVVFGRPIGEYQLTRVKLARMGALILACRQLTYSVARMMDEGAGDMEASAAKLFAGRAAEWLTREALQIHGGMGYAEETPVSRYCADARVLSIFEGAEETLALKVIARALLENAGEGG